MKILLISDEESKYMWDFFVPENFKDIDIIISCGDLKAEYLSFLVTMIKAPLFYIHGNHDNNYKNNPPEGCECIDGKIINYNGIRIMGLGGSMKYRETPLVYTEKEMRKRINKLKFGLFFNRGVDIIVSHAAPKGINDENDLCHEGFKCFLELIQKYSPKYFCHGHIHLNYGNKKRIANYKNTMVINAFDHYIFEY
ncbi:metallophosphoesterase family protein [Clostridium felsineum]|uniref:metallophosphoesterase family protein n=1 Tax=Clostridium felsineum TaxID=36839 RepID=UPI00098CAB67|nr:metallophosphoesterase [Clostridium felsineum]MCR3758251.1 metallophosphoesterase family protein [Clostridium felsineum]URZ15705.1 hypothetical protein CLFE_017520 [Clostridium felsineum DSM 794]